MTRGKENVKRWQFGLRSLFAVTIAASALVWGYTVDSIIGATVITVISSVCGELFLTQGFPGTSAGRSFGAWGSMIGGAIGGGFSISISLLVFSTLHTSLDILSTKMLGSLAACGLAGALVGTLIGFTTWFIRTTGRGRLWF